MDKVLRGLVVGILVLTIVSLYFANGLFAKRELLTKRNTTLEDQIVKVAKTVEAADAADATVPEIQKDISEVTERELSNPEKESVLEGYQAKIETQNLPTLNFDSTDKRLQLRSLYVLNPDGSYKISALDGKPETKGPGSMTELLDQLFERAKAQQATLNKTRAELSKMREHVSKNVEEVNKLKADGRVAKKSAKEAMDKAAAAEAAKADLEAKITKLTAEKRELDAEIADIKGQVNALTEEKNGINDELAKANGLVKELKERLKGTNLGSMAGDSGTTVTSLTAGDKGKIIECNDEYKFVVVEFSDATMLEMLGNERQNPLPQLDLNVRRPGRKSAGGEFVTRIKLRQLIKGKNMVVADILSDWQQVAVEKNDVVFF